MSNEKDNHKEITTETESYPDFDKIFQMQKDIQENTYGYKFSDLTIKELVEFWFMNKHALEDELSELFDAVGGIHDGIGNAAWKPWKANNSITKDKPFVGSLSERDREELLMEYVDILHFYINFGVSVGFTGSEVANAYVIKNKENVKRQKEGY